MMVVVSYDVNTIKKEGRRRLRKVAKTCENYGQRVQHSVFECLIEPVQFITLKSEFSDIFYPAEDSLRFYLLGANWKNRVEHMGCKEPIDIESPLII